MSTHVKATAVREGGWWIITIPAIDVVTQARQLKDVHAMAVEAAGLELELLEGDIDLDLDIVVPGGVETLWAESRKKDAEARSEAQEAGRLARAAVQKLRSQGLTQRDAAQILKISYQRVAQLEKTVVA